MKKVPQPSDFAKSLRTLLDDTNVLSRKDWANVLAVSPAAISQWVRDKTIPSPENLRQILQLLRRLDGVPKDILQDFNMLAAKPASRVSPHGHRMGRSIAEYLISPILNGFVSRFASSVRSLPPTQQEEFLNYAMQRLPEWIGAATNSALVDVLQRYPAKKRIAMADLHDIFDIFEKPNWTTLHVIATHPRELHEDEDETCVFFRTVTERFLARRDRTLHYVSPLNVTETKASKRKELSPIGSIKGTMNFIHMPRPTFYELMKLAARKCGDGEGRASHVIVFDLGGEKAFGYAWFDNQVCGSILSAEVRGHILKVIKLIEVASASAGAFTRQL